jgi:hypothetical protein
MNEKKIKNNQFQFDQQEYLFDVIQTVSLTYTQQPIPSHSVSLNTHVIK